MPHPAPWTLASASPGHLEAIRALLREAELPPDGVEAGDALVVACDGAEVVGCAGLEVHGVHGLLRSVAVRPAWRGTGLGAALARDRVEHARRLGLETVHLLTTTAPTFFARLGFREVERADVPPPVRASREFAELCPESAVVMALRLAVD